MKANKTGLQAKDCLASDGWCMSGLYCAEIHRDAPISLCLAIILETRAKSRKVADSLFAATESRKGA